MFECFVKYYSVINLIYWKQHVHLYDRKMDKKTDEHILIGMKSFIKLVNLKFTLAYTLCNNSHVKRK
jgi:hypothetical protein